MVQSRSPLLDAARTFLTLPDLFNFWLTGRKVSEFTNATTTQCYNPKTRDWTWDLFERLNIPGHLFQPIVQPGTVLDMLLPSVTEEVGGHSLPVIAPACHDTGSAVAAVPVSDPDYIYLSSGTWSLMGVEIDQPIITSQSLACDITNEGGVGGKFRFLKNIMGMWLLQECRREWARAGNDYSYGELTQMAESAPAFGPLIIPGDHSFLAHGDMVARIQSYCKQTGQEPPQSEGSIVRCILESLAMEYRWVAERLDELTGRYKPTIHIIGGGSRNVLLNQITANVTHRTVVAGPVEATAIGNVLVQALALGYIRSLEEGRQIIKRSFDVAAFQPQDSAPWDAAYQRYLTLKSSGSCDG